MSKVLLINDSKFESIVLKDVLNTIGYDVKVTDEYNAVKLIQSFSPELVIANLIMKEIRGDQLITMIKTQNPKIKCLLSSSSPISMGNFHHRKIDGVFKTPIDKPTLESLLSKMSIETHEDFKVEQVKEIEIKQDIELDEKEDDEQDFHVVKFCSACGGKLSEELKNRFLFCPYCGHKM